MSTLLSVSVALLAGLLMTRAFKPLKLPSVTAYLIAGVLIGPYCIGALHIDGLGFDSMESVEVLSLVSQVALGFIAFSIGSEFRIEDLKKIGKQAVVISDSIKAPLDSACTAHELGHALLHKGVNAVFLTDSTNFVTGRYEREADLFAAALLINVEDIIQNGSSIERIAKITGVPSYAVEQYMSLCVNCC